MQTELNRITAVATRDNEIWFEEEGNEPPDRYEVRSVGEGREEDLQLICERFVTIEILILV